MNENNLWVAKKKSTGVNVLVFGVIPNKSFIIIENNTKTLTNNKINLIICTATLNDLDFYSPPEFQNILDDDKQGDNSFQYKIQTAYTVNLSDIHPNAVTIDFSHEMTNLKTKKEITMTTINTNNQHTVMKL